MRLSGSALCAVCFCCPPVTADETLKRIFADWKAIRVAEEVYRFEYSLTKQGLTSKTKFPDVTGEITIHWPSQEYRIQERSTSIFDGKPILGIEVFDGRMRSKTIWPIQADGTIGKAPVEATTGKGDFTATQIRQDLFPFMLAKRVVLSRPRETYRPGQMWFGPDEALFFVFKRQGPLVTLNTFPRSAGSSRFYWQYDVDLDKQSAIRAMRSMQQTDGKPDVPHVEWQIDYAKNPSEWVITSWVERQYRTDTGKLTNRHDMKVTRFERTWTKPRFSHDIPDGQKVKSVLYPEYNPSAAEHLIVETTEFHDPDRSRIRLYLALTAVVLAIVAMAFIVRHRLRRPQNSSRRSICDSNSDSGSGCVSSG